MCFDDQYKKLKILNNINRQEEMFLKKIDFVLFVLCLYIGVFLESLNIIGNFLPIKEMIFIVTFVFYTFFVFYGILFISYLLTRFVRVKLRQFIYILNKNEKDILEEEEEFLYYTSFLDKKLWFKTFKSMRIVLFVTLVILIHMCLNITYLISTLN